MTDQKQQSIALSELPVDELIRYGCDLGLGLDARMGRGEMLRLVRQRQELLLEIDREALLDIVVWARRPVRQSASKEQLVKEIATIGKMDFEKLSDRGLNAYARLRDVPLYTGEPRPDIEARIRVYEPIVDRLRRKRRRVVGALIGKVVSGPKHPKDEEYRFLPEADGGPSLREDISDEGVVGGIARRLKGAADDYLRTKMDEIEARIDRKLDEIDLRLAEWRDREIANRLKMIKITLVASILVALLSLGYNYLVRNG
ncbi:MAG: hypothetical protein GXY44_08020 [Phycisphaerales bacterium]|nr:hypothetical protein [Phycisphaerales bacterium]